MAQVKFYKYNTTTSLQENESNIEEGSIVFDNEAKILYLVTKANTLEPYYGTDTKYSFSSSNNVLTITPSSGNSYNLTIDNVSHAGLADSATKAINDSEGNNISTTYLKNTGGIVSGTLEVDDLVVGNFLVKGSARFLNEIQGIIQYATKLGDDKSNLTVDNILSYLGSKVDRTTKVIAGNGLTGGGRLDSSITISHADTSDQSSVDGGTTQYVKSVALDDYGHVKGMSLADLPTNIANADLAQRAKYADAIRDPEYHDSSKRRSDINVTYNDGALHYFIGTNGCTGTTGSESFILHAAWDNSEWNTQLALPCDVNHGIKWRHDNSGTWSSWYDVIDSKNWASFIGTKTNPVNWANNATNATNAGKATTAENALKLNNFSQGFRNGFIPTYVEFPIAKDLVKLGFNTDDHIYDEHYYFLGLLQWAYKKYKDCGDILLIGCATPNSIGNCQIQIYSSDTADDNGVPRYSSGLYESLTGTLYIFRTYDYNYYFNQIDANNANYATLAATATIANSVNTSEGTTPGNRPVFFGWLGDKTKIVYDNTFQYDPSIKNLTVKNINDGAPITSANIGSQRVAEAVLADSAKSATTAGNSTLFNGYNFTDLKFNCINTRTITVEGDKDTFYPVGILVSSDKKWSQYISIHKDLGTKTPEIAGNHSNGTSSMWAMYETRNTAWDGNGGFLRTMYVSQPYASLIARVEPNIYGGTHMVVWLRGGGCVYNISSSNDLGDYTENNITHYGILIKYEEFNFGFSATYPVNYSPIALADINQYNKGIYATGNYAAYNYYRVKSAESADTANTATSAGTANIATTANSLSMDSVSDSNSAMLTDLGFKIYKYSSNSTNDTCTKGLDGFIQSFTWSNNSYGAQIYVDCDPTGIMALRQRNYSGAWTNWKYLIHSDNWNEYIGTNTNPVELANVAKTAQSVAWNAITGIPNLVTTDTSQTISGNKTFSNTTTLDDIIVGNALVNGNARFLNQITGNLKGDVEGNASTATLASVASLVAHSLKVGSKTYNGAADVTITPEDLGLSGAMRFIGNTTTAISEGSTTNPITINGSSVTAINGDVVLYNHIEFIWIGSWEQLGDEQSYALKSIQIKSGEGLTGGGPISNDVTLCHYTPTESTNTAGVINKAISTLSIDKFGHIVSSSTISIPTKLSDLTPDISNVYLPTTGGDMNAGARISASNGYLYIGNANNNGWLCFQDICSQNSPGDGIWSIRTNGAAIFQTVKSDTITAATSVTSPKFYGDLKGNADTSTESGNTQKFNNYTLAQLRPVFKGRDFTDGTLIKTDLQFKVGVNNPFFLRIFGNGYGQGIINLELQGYIYAENATTIENVEIVAASVNNYSGNNFSYIYIQCIDEKLCFWFPRLGYWHGYNAYCTYEYGGIVNHVTSITDVAKPDSPNELKLIPTYAINSENISRQSVSSALTAGSATSDGEGNNIANTYLKLSGGTVTGVVDFNKSIRFNGNCNILLRKDNSSCSSGIFHDTNGNGDEGVSIWSKHNSTSLRWHAGVDMTAGASGSMMGIAKPDFEISKASGTAKGYIGGYEIWHSGNLTGLSQLANDLGYITEAKYLSYLDTRHENPNPYNSTYSGVSYHLKCNSDIGLTGDPYAGVLNLRQWSDTTGGKEYQLAFTNGDINYRYGDSEWSTWTKLITTNNISSYTAGSATTAGQLSSTRKIWGNDFNGTQNINGDISYTGSIATYSMIRFLDNTIDEWGNGISIGGGGLTIIGSGESASKAQGKYDASAEDLILCSDEWIGIFPGQQDGYTDSKASYFHTNGAVSILCNTSSYSLSVNGTTNFTGASIIGSTLDVASNITSGNQVKGKTINIDSKCTIKYDDTDKCIKFVFA